MDPCTWPGVSSVCGATADAANALTEDASIRILSVIAQGVTGFAALLLEGLWNLIQGITTPQTDADFLQQWAGMIFAIALPITVMFMVFQVIGSVIRARGWNRSGVSSAVGGAAVAIVGTAVSLPVVHGATRMVDGAADAMSGAILGDIDSLGESFANAVGGDGVSFAELLTGAGRDQLIAEGAIGVLGGLVGMIVLGFLMIVGGIAVFAALLIRSLLLYVVVVTGPIAFLGLVWTPARAWFRRWCVAVVALIFTKLGVVVVFGLGIAAMNNLDFGGGLLETLGRLLTGALLLLIAALVPLVAFRFFDFLGEEAATSMHAGAQASVARSREVLGHMDPRRVAARLHGSNGHSGGQPAGQPSRAGAGGQPSQPQPGSGQPAPTGGRSGPSQPWKTGTKPGTGQSGAGWSRPAGTGAGAGAGAAGGVAGGAGAVVGAGTAAGQAAAAAGSRAGQQAGQQQARPNSSPEPKPAGTNPPDRP
ncbi:MAG: type IV secretion system protein [bacterium]